MVVAVAVTDGGGGGSAVTKGQAKGRAIRDAHKAFGILRHSSTIELDRPASWLVYRTESAKSMRGTGLRPVSDMHSCTFSFSSKTWRAIEGRRHSRESSQFPETRGTHPRERNGRRGADGGPPKVEDAIAPS